MSEVGRRMEALLRGKLDANSFLSVEEDRSA